MILLERMVGRERAARCIRFGFRQYDEAGEDVGKVGWKRGGRSGEEGLVALVHSE